MAIYHLSIKTVSRSAGRSATAAAELAEKREDACVAREHEVWLCPPSYRPRNSGDERNHHAHLLRISRKFEANGLGAKLDTEKALPGSRRI